jgi:hypothetical protein
MATKTGLAFPDALRFCMPSIANAPGAGRSRGSSHRNRLRCHNMLYVLLIAAVVRVLVLMWTSPVQVVALVLTMHGLRQVGIAVLPELAASPLLANLAVAGLVAVALALSSIRRGSRLPPGTHLACCGIYIVFYAIYAAYVVATDALHDDSMATLLVRVAPYVVLQLLATTALIGASSPAEIRGALTSMWFICLAIVGIAAMDTSVQVNEAEFRLMLRSQQEEAPASNPLALADVGVALMVTTLHILPAAARAAFPSLARIDWLAALVGWGRFMVIGAIAFVVLWISRVEPLMAVLAMVVTAVASKNGARVGLMVAVGFGLPLTMFLGVWQAAFGVLVEWFPRLQTIDEGFEVRMAIVERLFDRYASGGFDVLLLGLGPGYSLMNFGLYPHNHLIECLTELGLVGLVVAAMGPITAWKKGMAVMQTSPPGDARQNACFFHTMLTFSILTSMKRGSIVHPDTFMWATILTLLHAHDCVARRAVGTSIGLPAARSIARRLTMKPPIAPSPARPIPTRPRHAAA